MKTSRGKILMLILLLAAHRQPQAVAADDKRVQVAVLNICCSPEGWAPHRLMLTAFEPLINGLTDFFPEWRLKIFYECAIPENPGSATRAFIEGYFAAPAKLLILGVAYSQQSQVVAAVAKFYNVPVISYGNASPLLSDKSNYPTFSRLQLTHSLYNPAIIAVLLKYKWKRIGILLTEADQIYPVGVQFESDLSLSQNNITVAYKALYKTSARDALARMKTSDIRIIVVFSYGYLEDEPIQCLIHEFGLFGPKYQWIFNGWHDLPASRSVPGCPLQVQIDATQNAVIFNAAFSDPGYKAPPSPTGLAMSDLANAFSSANPNRSVTNATLARTFDTLLTAALAINATVATQGRQAAENGSSEFRTRLLANIRRQDFQGFEGPVKLDSNGDRVGQVIIYQIRGNAAEPTGSFDPSSRGTVWKRDLAFSGGKPPIDGTVVIEQRLSIDPSAATACRVLSAAGVVLAVVSVSVNFRFRHLKLIKLSSPNVNLLIALGCTLGYASCVLMSLDSLPGRYQIVQCWSVTFCLALGYSCAFGAMFAKTWRVHVIFTNKRLKRLAIKDWHLMSVVAALVLVDLVVLASWILIDPLQLTLFNIESIENTSLGILFKYQAAVCRSGMPSVWNGILIGIKGILLIFGIFFAWETRHVHIQALNDSKQIGICVYNTMIMGALAVCLSFVLPVSAYTLQFALVSVCILICSTATLLLVFGSKILLLIQHGPNKVDDIHAGLGGAGSAAEGAASGGASSAVKNVGGPSAARQNGRQQGSTAFAGSNTSNEADMAGN